MSAQRAISLIVIHCSATPSGKALGNAHQSAAEVIDGWHAARGFAREPGAVRAFSTGLPHIGYHYVIDVDGIAQSGRSVSEIPAQAKGFNAQSIGICMVGGAEKTGRYTHAQWRCLQKLVSGLAQAYRVPMSKAYSGRPIGICGHRDLSVDLNNDGAIESQEWVKTCPGFSVAEWLNRGCVPLPEHLFGEGWAA